MTFSLFRCSDFDFSTSRFTHDMRIKCWSRPHFIFTLAAGAPLLLIWVIGIPLFSFLILLLNRRRLNDPRFMSKFITLYRGLRDKAFYWESVNIFRKLALIALNFAIPASTTFYKPLLGVIFLMSLQRLQHFIKPYQSRLLNELEQKEIMTSMITLYGATIFL